MGTRHHGGSRLCLKRLTVAFYLQGSCLTQCPAIPHRPDSGAVPRDPGVVESVIWLVIIIGLSLWLGGRTVSKREYVLEQ